MINGGDLFLFFWVELNIEMGLMGGIISRGLI